MMSRGGARYQSRCCLVTAASASATTWRLNGLALATSTDLLKRSNGRIHQRRQTSAGKLRASSTSTSYLSSGREPMRLLSGVRFGDVFRGGEFCWVKKWRDGVSGGGGGT